MYQDKLKYLLLLISLLRIELGLAHSEIFLTSFEFSNSGTFEIGQEPLTASFSGGSAQTFGMGACYRQGIFSWHVPSGGEANVTFSTPAETVDFWFRDTLDAASSKFEIIDTNGNTIASGNYLLNIPLDASGQFKLQVYADGFALSIQVFDEFQRINDVRLARASECKWLPYPKRGFYKRLNPLVGSSPPPEWLRNQGASMPITLV